MGERIYLIADTHFGHKKLLTFADRQRPFDSIEAHDAELIRRWNAVVRKRDTVWHLGDVLFGVAAFETLAHLNGIKKLVMGNHDRYPTVRYLEHFRSIHGCAQLAGCVLSHMPGHPSQFSRYHLNIHGHLHHNLLDDPRYQCVSAEQTGLAPISLETVLNRAATAGVGPRADRS